MVRHPQILMPAFLLTIVMMMACFQTVFTLKCYCDKQIQGKKMDKQADNCDEKGEETCDNDGGLCSTVSFRYGNHNGQLKIVRGCGSCMKNSENVAAVVCRECTGDLCNGPLRQEEEYGSSSSSSPVLAKPLAQSICTQQKNYAQTKRLGPPLKSRNSDAVTKCGWWKWHKGGGDKKTKFEDLGDDCIDSRNPNYPKLTCYCTRNTLGCGESGIGGDVVSCQGNDRKCYEKREHGGVIRGCGNCALGTEGPGGFPPSCKSCLYEKCNRNICC